MLLVTAAVLGLPDAVHTVPLFETEALAFQFGRVIRSPIVDEFNGDLRPDVAALDTYPRGRLLIALGNGDGSLAAPMELETPPGPGRLASADLNGDGSKDLAVVSQGSLSVVLGHGDGTFGLRVDQPVAWADPTSDIALGDLNGDGFLDAVVTAGYSGRPSSLLLGNGDGTFREGFSMEPRYAALSVAIADLTLDGLEDLAISDQASISVLAGAGDGTFTLVTNITGIWSSALVASDFNADGMLDLAAAQGGYSGAVLVYLGTGAGAFAPGVQVSTQPYCTSIATGDLDGDGRIDLVASSSYFEVEGPSYHEIQVFLARDDGAWDPGRPVGTPMAPYAIRLSDLDADGRLDLVVADGSRVLSLHGNGDGTFGTRNRYAVPSRPQAVALGDVNGDSHVDVLSANYGASQGREGVSILLGKGDASLQPAVSLQSAWAPAALTVTDMDSDGRLDLVVANEAANTVSVFLGSGDGSFRSNSDFGTGEKPAAVATGDLNQDGVSDVAAVNGASASVSVLLGAGAGMLGARNDFPVDRGPAAVALRDVDHDGRVDLLVANSGSNSLSVLLGDGHGGFPTRTDFRTGKRPRALAVADLNGDAIPDAVVANSDFDSSSVSVLIGDGAGGFSARGQYAVGAGPFSVIAADVDGDGARDVATANLYAATVSILLGSGDGSLGMRSDYAVEYTPAGLAVGDLNGDRRFDLVVANAGSNSVSVLRIRSVHVQRAPTAFGPYQDLTPVGLAPALTMSFSDPQAANRTGTWHRLALVSVDGAITIVGPIRVAFENVKDTRLFTPYAPPDGALVVIRYRIASGVSPVRLDLYDARGRLIRPLLWRPAADAEENAILWDRLDSRGVAVPRGVYLVRLSAGRAILSSKLVLVGQ